VSLAKGAISMIQNSSSGPSELASMSLGSLAPAQSRFREQWLRGTLSAGRNVFVLLVELLLVTISFELSMSHFESRLAPLEIGEAAILIVVLVLVFRGAALIAFGVCERSFRHAGLSDAIAIAKAVAVSSVALYAACFGLKTHFDVVPPGGFFLADAATLFLMLSTFQFSARIYHFFVDTAGTSAAAAKRVVIIGAGDAGVSVLRELLDMPRSGIVPVALVDDDPMKRGTLICGVPVVGGLPNLAAVLSEFQASEVLVCIPSATSSQRKRILAACRKGGVPIRTLPGVVSLLDNRASMRDLRSITIEDLLQRDEFVPDRNLTSQLVAAKVVLVTGAGGSIGSELCRQIAAACPRRLVLVDKSENSLFYCHLGIQEACPGLEIIPVLGDVTDDHFVRTTMLQGRPNLVFHAAAFKHVGMMELHPDQAIRNNVLGTRNVLLAATDAGAEIFVNVSTDKAVNPRCYMGLSKKLAELFVKESDARHRTRCMSVRFGNVAGSTGSVLRIFSEQIRQGKPLHVTDPHATRYFMSIPEAVFLILCAASLGKGGETFIFDMGEPVNIYELARTLMLFAGVMPGEELPIHFTGLKDGEKVAEELWDGWEVPESTDNSRIFKLAGSNPLSIDIFSAVGRFHEFIAAHDHAGLVQYIAELVPGFAQQRTSLSEFATNQVQDDLERVNA